MSRESEDEMAEEIQEALQGLAGKRGRPVLCFFGEINQISLHRVRSLAVQLKEFDKLSVLLDSPGGDIEDAYRMVLSLRDNAENIEALVPRWAKSAATFFCLAADTVYMGQYGELGPLDPQRLNLRGSAIPVSALESFNALEQLLSYSLDSLDGIVKRLLINAPLDIPYALQHAHPLFAAIVSPLYSQVDPHELGEAGRSLAISQEYAMRVMERWAYSDIGDDARWKIARRLTWDYPTHGFVIDLEEAQQIGLNAERPDEESDALCREILDNVDSYIDIKVDSYIDIAFPHIQKAQIDQGEQDEHHAQPKGENIVERNPDGQQNAL